MIEHKKSCDMFAAAVDCFISCRPAQFLTTQELKILALAFPPCVGCHIHEDLLSPMTGRLYLPMWSIHKKRIQSRENPTVIDMFATPDEVFEL